MDDADRHASDRSTAIGTAKPDAKRPDAAKPDAGCVDRVFPSPNHGERVGAGSNNHEPDSIILHYTGMSDAAKALLWLCNPLSQVSCHYFVFEDGRIFQLVPESRRAWHAGRSFWAGESDMNSASIGIEIAHPGHELGAGFGADGKPVTPPDGAAPNLFPPPGPPFPAAQIDAVIRLVADIKTRCAIADARILAHSDIAPGRKIDPGERFPWAKLAEAGLGLWPRFSRTGAAIAHAEPGSSAENSMPANSEAKDIQPWGPDHRSAKPALVRDEKAYLREEHGPTYRAGDEGMPVRALQSLFAAFGYGIEITGVYDQRTTDVVAAFQRHWRQARVDGVADGETICILRALMARQS